MFWQSCYEPLYNELMDEITIPSESILVRLYEATELDEDSVQMNGFMCLLQSGIVLFVNECFFIDKQDPMKAFTKL